jgi:hypothetical protein
MAATITETRPVTVNLKNVFGYMAENINPRNLHYTSSDPAVLKCDQSKDDYWSAVLIPMGKVGKAELLIKADFDTRVMS